MHERNMGWDTIQPHEPRHPVLREMSRTVMCDPPGGAPRGVKVGKKEMGQARGWEEVGESVTESASVWADEEVLHVDGGDGWTAL
jgi:hypothetical protein